MSVVQEEEDKEEDQEYLEASFLPDMRNETRKQFRNRLFKYHIDDFPNVWCLHDVTHNFIDRLHIIMRKTILSLFFTKTYDPEEQIYFNPEMGTYTYNLA